MMWFWDQNRRIYLDYAAATPVSDEALRAYQNASHIFGNPSGLHQEGLMASEVLEKARSDVARMLQCRSGEIIFTSGGTEGNNLAIFGAIRDPRSAHIIVSAIEHPSILEPIAELEKRGTKASRLAPDKHGQIRPETVAAALTHETRLVSIGWANSEIGVVQLLSAIARVIREHESKHGTRIIFHTDAGQAPLYIKSTAHSLGVDLMTLDSGKLYGPRGVGVLFIRREAELRPTMFGGGQEKGIRPGTQNVALATGFAAALRAAAEEREIEAERLAELKNYFIKQVTEVIPGTVVNGEGAKHTLPHIVNISIPNADAEYTALALDHRDIAVSTKTSCKEGERESAVVAALESANSDGQTIGEGEHGKYGKRWRAESALRFSFGRTTTRRDLDRAVATLADIVLAA